MTAILDACVSEALTGSVHRRSGYCDVSQRVIRTIAQRYDRHVGDAIALHRSVFGASSAVHTGTL